MCAGTQVEVRVISQLAQTPEEVMCQEHPSTKRKLCAENDPSNDPTPPPPPPSLAPDPLWW